MLRPESDRPAVGGRGLGRKPRPTLRPRLNLHQPILRVERRHRLCRKRPKPPPKALARQKNPQPKNPPIYLLPSKRKRRVPGGALRRVVAPGARKPPPPRWPRTPRRPKSPLPRRLRFPLPRRLRLPRPRRISLQRVHRPRRLHRPAHRPRRRHHPRPHPRRATLPNPRVKPARVPLAPEKAPAKPRLPERGPPGARRLGAARHRSARQTLPRAPRPRTHPTDSAGPKQLGSCWTLHR